MNDADFWTRQGAWFAHSRLIFYLQSEGHAIRKTW